MPKSPTSTKRTSLPSTSNDLPPPPPPKLASTSSSSSISPKIATSSLKRRSTFCKKSKSASSQPPSSSDPSVSPKLVAVSASSPPPPPPTSSLPSSDTSSSPSTSQPSFFSSYSFAFPTSTSASSGSISLLDQLGDAGQLFRRASGQAESTQGEIRKQEKSKTGGKGTKGSKTGTEREAAVLKERSAKALEEKALLSKPKREAPSAAPPPRSPSTTTSKPPPSSAKPTSPKSSTALPRTEVPALKSLGSSSKKDPRGGKQQSTSVAVPPKQPSSLPQPSPKATSSTRPPLVPSATTPSPPIASSSSPPSSPSSDYFPTRPTTPALPAFTPVPKSLYHIADDLRRKEKESKEYAEAAAAEMALRRARANQPPPLPPLIAGPSNQIRASPLSPSTTTSKPTAVGPTNGGSSSSVSSVASSIAPLTPSAPPRHLTSHPPVPLAASNHPSLFPGSKPPIHIMSSNPYPPQQPLDRANLIPPPGQFNDSSSPNRTHLQTGGPIPYSLLLMDPKGKGREHPRGPPNGYPSSQQQQQFQHPQGGPPRFQQHPGRDSFPPDQRNRPPPPPQNFGSRPEPRPPDNYFRLGPAQPYGQDPRRGLDGRNQQQQYQNRPPPFYSDIQRSLPPSASVRFQPQPVLPPDRFPPSSSASIPPFASASRPLPPFNTSRPSISPITSSIPLPLPPLHSLPPRPSDSLEMSQPRPELGRRQTAPADASPPSNAPETPSESNAHDGSPPIIFSTPPPRSFPPTFLAPSNLPPGSRATDFVLQEKPSGTTLYPRNSRPSHGPRGGGPSSPIAHHHHHSRTNDVDPQRREEPRWIPPLHNRSGPTAQALDEELGRMGIGRLTSRKTNFTAECYVHVESNSPSSTTFYPLDHPISPHDLQTVCEIRFGPVASITLVLPHKTRAFLTFVSVGSALRAMMVSLPPEDGGEGGAGFGDQKRFVFEPRKRMLVDLYRGADSGVEEDRLGGVGGMRERELERLRIAREEEEREGDEGEADGGRGLWKRRREEEERRRVLEGEREKEEERRRWEELVGEQAEGTGEIGWREERGRAREERLVGEKADLECPICLQLLANPHILACCGHTLCLRCIEQVLQSPPRTCPCCREPIGKPIPNRLACTAVESFVQRTLFAFGER